MYYANVIFNIILGFSLIIFYMSYMGKTQITQLTPVDLIGNFILGGIIGGVIYNEEISFLKYVSLLLIGLLLIGTFNWIVKKIDVFRGVAIGNSIPIIKNGKFLIHNLSNNKNKIDIGIVASMMRIQGIKSFKDINYAQIEPNGQLSIIKKNDDIDFSVILICNGSIQRNSLKIIGKDESWLISEMDRKNIKSAQEVFIAEFWNGEINFILID